MPSTRRQSFNVQMEKITAQRRTSAMLDSIKVKTLEDERKEDIALEIEGAADDITAPFESKFDPSEMRQLALVAHNHMKPAMKEFIRTFSEILKKFRITGTETTMRMCKTMWGEDNPEISYGLTCTSGPLGGDAQIAALMCIEDLGGLIFFVDPLSAHPHQADIDSLVRLSNCGNVIVCSNPTSAMSMMHTLKLALQTGNRGVIPSFFQTLESPAVAEYRHQQELALAAAVASGQPPKNMSKMRLMQSIITGDQDDDDDRWSNFSDDYDSDETSKESTKDSSENVSGSMDEEGYKDDHGGSRAALPRTLSKRESLSKLYGVKQPPKKKGKRSLMKLGKNLKKKLSM